MPMQLFGIGKAALDRLFTPFVERPARCCQTMGVNCLSVLLPDMPGHGSDLLCIAGALPKIRTGFANRRVGAVFPIPAPVGRAVA